MHLGPEHCTSFDIGDLFSYFLLLYDQLGECCPGVSFSELLLSDLQVAPLEAPLHKKDIPGLVPPQLYLSHHLLLL